MSFKMLATKAIKTVLLGKEGVQAALVCGSVLLATSCATTPAAAQSPLPILTVTGVANNVDSAKISFLPIAGAQDYRVYDVTDPSKVKYAGQWHLTAGWGGWNLNFARNADGSLVFPLQTVPGNPGQTQGEMVTVPAWEVEWNGVQPGRQETLVVEAVDAQGPFPSGNMYSGVDNGPLETCVDGMCMVGANEGITLDGLLSTNGQGASTNMPHAIARSKPFIVGTPTVAAPPMQMAGASVYEPFTAATMSQNGPIDNQNGNMHYTIRGTKPWETIVEQADTAHTKAFVENGHIMDVLFDGGTPYLSSVPMHNNHSALGISPLQTVEIGNGHILHVTMEVDAHSDGRRWAGIVVAPANDPVQSFYSSAGFRVNNSNQAFLAEVEGSSVNFVQQTGPAAGPSATQTFQSYTRPMLFGESLQPVYFDSHLGPTPCPPSGQQFQQTGHGLDNRTRFDLFLSSTHVAFYEDGVKVGESDLSQPLGFPRCKVYFAHYVYHTTNEVNECSSYTPWESFWINKVPYSDERHWANLGYEVLPNSKAEWSATATLVHPHAYQAPAFVPGS